MKSKTESRAVRLELDGSRHQTLRVLAAQSGKPMSQFVRELVEKEIDRKSKEAK